MDRGRASQRSTHTDPRTPDSCTCRHCLSNRCGVSEVVQHSSVLRCRRTLRRELGYKHHHIDPVYPLRVSRAAPCFAAWTRCLSSLGPHMGAIHSLGDPQYMHIRYTSFLHADPTLRDRTECQRKILTDRWRSTTTRATHSGDEAHAVPRCASRLERR